MFALSLFYLGFAVSFAVAVREVAAAHYDLDPWAVAVIFIAAHGVSLVPFLRGAVVLWLCWMLFPWYGAIPAALGVCVVRALLSAVLWGRVKARQGMA